MFAPRVDSLNRRIRFDKEVNPRGKRIVIDDDDIRMWTAIHSHGPLPTHYLYEFTSKKDFNTHQKRLTKQRHGTEEDGPYLIRCPMAVSDPLLTKNVYRLHKNAELELEKRGLYSLLAERKGWAVHQLMGSCITASLELALKDIKFIPRHVILSENNKPLRFELTRSPRKSLVPDELFGLDYGNDFYRFFVCEWDRNSEPWKRTTSEGVDFAGKLADYIEVIRSGGFKPHTTILIVTTSPSRAQSIKEEIPADLAHLFIVNVLDYFANPWKMPPVLTDIVKPWERADGKLFDFTKRTAP